MRILSHPFRLAPNGSAATVDLDSEQADIEQIVVLAMTRSGERPLVPTFGITDPVFDHLEPAELAVGIATFGPPVRLRGVRTKPINDTAHLVEIEFE